MRIPTSNFIFNSSANAMRGRERVPAIRRFDEATMIEGSQDFLKLPPTSLLPEWRQNPITGQRVIIAPERGTRPIESIRELHFPPLFESCPLLRRPGTSNTARDFRHSLFRIEGERPRLARSSGAESVSGTTNARWGCGMESGRGMRGAGRRRKAIDRRFERRARARIPRPDSIPRPASRVPHPARVSANTNSSSSLRSMNQTWPTCPPTTFEM